MTLREALVRATEQLRAAEIENAARDARALLAMAAGIPADRVTLEGAMELADPTLVERLVQRRISREPVSKILGKRLFWGHEFTVSPETLDPRPETETLISTALEIGPVNRFADLGTGTGIIAISLLKEWPKAQAVATDISPSALEVAAANAETLNVQNRLGFHQVHNNNQWLDEDLGCFDLILSNPPYISDAEMTQLSPEVFNHDPHLALTPGGDGMGPYRDIAAQSLAHLKSGGHLMVETGWRQGADVKAIFERAGLTNVQILPDMDKRDRVVQATKP
ncbi:[protein release factor]-glutamine N5-methyltransferase [Shimia gijangensis]|uniref:Release factor glutamine methyltransferase n=1 Tax=Shimia gijangensis TaxID=1470563 RepID=A0A1M6HE52_9RHOB|nr:peptide chain release factor N(5)-glutamine methyltransferase [Shimia gijangensis]SHJ20406.1 [protein release factor]-glutamine N5-methyltransferase [Shimia gijangensis]